MFDICRTDSDVRDVPRPSFSIRVPHHESAFNHPLNQGVVLVTSISPSARSKVLPQTW